MCSELNLHNREKMINKSETNKLKTAGDIYLGWGCAKMRVYWSSSSSWLTWLLLAMSASSLPTCLGFSYGMVQRHPSSKVDQGSVANAASPPSSGGGGEFDFIKFPLPVFDPSVSVLGLNPSYDPSAADPSNLGPPPCSRNGTNNFCLEDTDYPASELRAYIQIRYGQFVTSYSELRDDLSTANAVEGLTELDQEFYICPAKVDYLKPLRAKNFEGKWKIIVNLDQFTQTIRLETCQSTETPCTLVSPCYVTNCLQKNAYHRLLTFEPRNHYYPFRIDLFRVPSACSCHVGQLKQEP